MQMTERSTLEHILMSLAYAIRDARVSLQLYGRNIVYMGESCVQLQ